MENEIVRVSSEKKEISNFTNILCRISLIHSSVKVNKKLNIL